MVSQRLAFQHVALQLREMTVRPCRSEERQGGEAAAFFGLKEGRPVVEGLPRSSRGRLRGELFR